MIDLDRATAILSPKQITSIAQSRHVRTSIWAGAVRSGKTVASLLAFLIAVAEAKSGLIIVSGKTLQTIERNVIGPLQDPELFGDLGGHNLAALTKHTTGSNTATILGRTVHLIGANDVRAEGNLRGLTACLAYIDEATLVPPIFWTQMLARLSTDGARLLATTNPDGPAHWLRQDYLLREPELNLRSWHFTLDDNPKLPADYVRDLKAEYVGLWYKRMILGQWCLAEGAIYDMFDDERHVVDVLPPIERWIALGVDYGTTNPFAGLLLGLGVDRNLYLAHEWWYSSKTAHKQLTDVEYSKRLRAWLDELPFPGTDLTGIRPQFVVVDPSAASFIAQLQADKLTPALGNNDVLDGIRTVSSLLGRERLFIHRSCRNLLNELPGYSWDADKAAEGEDAPVKVDDHAVDAMRYAIYTTRAIWQGALRQDPLEVAA